MDAPADLRTRAEKSREFDFQCGDRSFKLRTPTPRQVLECLHGRRLLAHGDDGLVTPLLRYHLLCRAIIGWSGVRARHVLPDLEGAEAAAPLPWSADAVEPYLDAQPDDERALGAELLARIAQRRAAFEEDAKN